MEFENLTRVEQVMYNDEMISFENGLFHCDSQFISHYTSPQGLLSIFKENGDIVLWFTQYDSLNDRSERENIIISYNKFIERNKDNFTEEFILFLQSITITDKTYIAYKTEYSVDENGNTSTHYDSKEQECDTYLCCFSTIPDSLQMWNYYSKNNRYEGYSISFSSDYFEEALSFGNGYKMTIAQVIYNDSDKLAIWEKFVFPLYEIYKTATMKELSEIKYRIQNFMENLQFLFKDVCFMHENEVRVILRVPKNMRKKDLLNISRRKYRSSNGYVIPYVEVKCHPDSCHFITTAPLLEKDLAIKNLKDMLDNYNHPFVAVFPSDIPIRF